MTINQQKSLVSSGSVATSSAQAGFLARPSTARILPFAVYMGFIAFADALSYLALPTETLRWLYPVKILVVIAVLLAYRRTYFELAWVPISRRDILASIVTGSAVLVLWVNLDAGWMQIGSAAGFDPTDGAGRVNWLLVGCRIAGAALVVPVMEELFWRSFLMRWLENRDFLTVAPRHVGMGALLITVVLFGFEHNLWLAGIVAGVAYSLLYMLSGNLWTAIIAHAVTNALLGVWIMVTSNWAYW